MSVLFCASFLFLSPIAAEEKGKIEPGKVYRLEKDQTYNIKVGQKIIIRFEDEELQLTFTNPKMIDQDEHHIESVDFNYSYKGILGMSGQKVSFIKYKRVNEDGKVTLNKVEGSQKIKYGKIKLEWSYNSNNALWLYMKKGQRFKVEKN